MASASRALHALALPPKRQRSFSPPDRSEAPQQPLLAPVPEAARPHEGGGGRAEFPCPKARPHPTATKSGPPQPPEVLAATSKAKPAQMQVPRGPGKGTIPGRAAQPPQEESSSEYYSTSESQGSEAAPQEDEKQGTPQRKPCKDQRDPRAPGSPRDRAGPEAYPQGKDRRRPPEPASSPGTASRAHYQQENHRERPKAKLVQHISPEREPPRRRRVDSPAPDRRRRSRSAGRNGRARREDSRSPRAYHGRRYPREDSRSPCSRRRRSHSRRHVRTRDSPGEPSEWDRGYAQSLQKGGRRAGQGHAQEAGRPGQTSLQDGNQARGPQHAWPGSQPHRGRDGPERGYWQVGKNGKGKGPPQASGKGRRGQGAKGEQPRGPGRKPPRTDKQSENDKRRKERAAGRLTQKAAELRQEQSPGSTKEGPGLATKWFD